MNEIITKKRIKCVPIVITPEIKEQIRIFKDNLLEIRVNPEYSSEFDAKTIDIVLNDLDDYDRNVLIAFYSIADCSYVKLSSLFGISPPVLHRKIKLILNKIKELNDTPKSPNNQPRGYPNC